MKIIKDSRKIIVVLCCGTKSFEKQLDPTIYQIISIDILGKFNPDILADILYLKYKELGLNPGDIYGIWAGPPCTEYSHAKRTGVRNLELADAIAKKCIEIIEYFKPKYWFIENPQTGLLKSRDFMIKKNLPFVDVLYCQYGYTYRKQTRIWTNLKGWVGKVCNKKTCEMVKDNKHIGSAGNGRTKYTFKSFSQEEKYSMPPRLMIEIISHMK